MGTLAGPTSPINQIGRWSNQFGCHQLYRPARRRGVLSFEDTSPRRQQQTMTSREIAELVESRHDNVKRTVDTLSAKGAIPFPQAEEKATAGCRCNRRVTLPM